MSNNRKNKEITSINYQIPAVVDGEIIEIEQVDDQIFSNKMIGDGYGIIPTGQIIYAPVDAQVERIAPTHHAIYLSLEEGFKILIHIGIDTIELKGSNFDCLIEEGNLVSKGDKLITFDPEYIKDEGYNPTISVILLNDAKYNMEFTTHPKQEAKAIEDLALEIEISL